MTLKVNELLHVKYTLSYVFWGFFLFVCFVFFIYFLFVNHECAQFGFLALFSVLVIWGL